MFLPPLTQEEAEKSLGHSFQLQSGGPALTLTGIDFQRGNHVAIVKWFEDGKLREEAFPFPALYPYVHDARGEGIPLEHSIGFYKNEDNNIGVGVNSALPEPPPVFGFVFNVPDKELLTQQNAQIKWRQENPDAVLGATGQNGMPGYYYLGLPKAPATVRFAIGVVERFSGSEGGFTFEDSITVLVRSSWKDFDKEHPALFKLEVNGKEEFATLAGMGPLLNWLAAISTNEVTPENFAEALKLHGVKDFTEPYFGRWERFSANFTDSLEKANPYRIIAEPVEGWDRARVEEELMATLQRMNIEVAATGYPLGKDTVNVIAFLSHEEGMRLRQITCLQCMPFKVSVEPIDRLEESTPTKYPMRIDIRALYEDEADWNWDNLYAAIDGYCRQIGAVGLDRKQEADGTIFFTLYCDEKQAGQLRTWKEWPGEHNPIRQVVEYREPPTGLENMVATYSLKIDCRMQKGERWELKGIHNNLVRVCQSLGIPDLQQGPRNPNEVFMVTYTATCTNEQFEAFQSIQEGNKLPFLVSIAMDKPVFTPAEKLKA